MVDGQDLEKFQRVVVDQDLCIECGSCVAVCPFQAFEFDDRNKARLIWDRCHDDFSCSAICPASCIWKTQEAPTEARAKVGWLRFDRNLNEKESGIFEAWKNKYTLRVEGPKKG